MRVISGSQKGKMLQAVPGTGTRPTTDKVKEAIFNMVGPYFHGGMGLDLFAGSGGLGIEGLSRGLDKVIFVDKDKNALQTIKNNLVLCEFEDQSEVYRNDYERALKALMKREMNFDVIFLDPPYKKQKLVSILEFIDEKTMLNASGYVVCEHSSDISLPEEVGQLSLLKNVKYGIIGVSIYGTAEFEGEK